MQKSLKVPIRLENTVVSEDCFDVLGLSVDFLLDLFHVGMFSSAVLDTLDLTGGFLNVSKC